jgi:hypothetical protein
MQDAGSIDWLRRQAMRDLIDEGAWQTRVCARSAGYGQMLAERADT